MPITSALLKKYKEMGLELSFKAKMKPNGTLDKIKLMINVPLSKLKELGVDSEAA